jgi:hypothetical protein
VSAEQAIAFGSAMASIFPVVTKSAKLSVTVDLIASVTLLILLTILITLFLAPLNLINNSNDAAMEVPDVE